MAHGASGSTHRGPPSEAKPPRLGQILRHYDRSQLWFQIAEIVGRRTYLQHGVQVREGDVVLDVGANVGVAAAFFASECRAGLVHSFEPVAPVFNLLRENLRDFPSCVAHEYGLSASPGRASITYYPNAAAMSGLYADPRADRAHVRACMINSGSSETDADERSADLFRATTLTCELRTLSMVLRELSLDRVDLLKIDVERAELDVLDGIEEKDWHRIKQVVLEVHGDQRRCEAIGGALTKRGFAVTTDQDEVTKGTLAHMLYATRR